MKLKWWMRQFMKELQLYAEDNKEGLKVFIGGNDMAEYAFLLREK